MNTLNDILERLFQYYNVVGITELADKMGITQPTISKWKARDSISAVKKKCRELGIYSDIFGDLNNSQINNLQNSTFDGHSSGVDNSTNKSNNSKDEFNECDEFTKSLFKQLCLSYKDRKPILQAKIFELIQNA